LGCHARTHGITGKSGCAISSADSGDGDGVDSVDSCVSDGIDNGLDGRVEGVPLRVNTGALLATPLGLVVDTLLASPLGSHAMEGWMVCPWG
jgi:hypothetical protein